MIKEILNNEDFNEVLKSEKLTVVDFSAVWCGPCRMMEPVLEEASEKLSNFCNFYKVDIDQNEDLASKYNIMYVPTFIVMKNGVEVSRTSGYVEMEDFEKFISENLKKTEN
ncbi:MAG: thioredoxin [Clostridia bacterium]|nr:thioredoxin [Clostridia bacterium]